MPHFPETFHRIMAVSRDDPHEDKKVVAVLSGDPVITFRVLRVVNSAYFGMAREIGSVEHAVRVLGCNSIRNMVLTFSAVGVLPPRLADSFDVDKFLLHSLTTAHIAEQLARHFKDTGLPEAYTAGLLHDFGQVLLAWTFPTEFAEASAQALAERIPQLQVEKQRFRTDHAQLGAALATRWNFPPALTQSIAGHHQAPEGQGLGRCLFLANQLPKLLDTDTGAATPLEPLPSEWSADVGTYENLIGNLPNLEDTVMQAQTLMAGLRH
jgi:putative nucleotidyltransferase with HDIG domain